MKKLIICFSCVILLLSCNFQIPQSVTIKGNPEFFLSLGSPFKDKEGLLDYISPERIKQMMNDAAAGAQSEIKIYEYRGPDVDGDVLSYLLHYPIVEMQLDLFEYVDLVMQSEGVQTSVTIPDLESYGVGGLFPPGGLYLDYDVILQPNDINIIPLFRVPLPEMVKLVKNVKGHEGSFGIRIKHKQTFEDYIYACIPTFGIGEIVGGVKNYVKGTKVVDGSDVWLEFSNPSTKTVITPENDLNENGELDVYVKLMGPCSGDIAIDLVFDWESATIDTSGNGLSGTYEINNSLGNFLGESGGVEFSKVLGYVYVDGISGSGAHMSLEADSVPLIPGGSLLASQSCPEFTGDLFNVKMPEHSLGTDGIDLAAILNNTSSSTTDLFYQIDITSWEIERANLASGIKIAADLVVLLPLELRIKTPAAINGYVKLDLGDAFDFSNNEGNDLFGRTDGDGGLFKYLEKVTIILRNLRTTVIDRTKFAVYAKNQDGTEIGFLDFGLDEPSLSIAGNILNPVPFKPFSPRFEALLKKDAGKDYGTFRILRLGEGEQAEFDFTLALAAKVGIEETIEF